MGGAPGAGDGSGVSSEPQAESNITDIISKANSRNLMVGLQAR